MPTHTGFPVELDGETFTEAEFAGYSVFTRLPQMLNAAVADLAAKVAAGATHVATALGYRNDAAASASTAGGHVTTAAGYVAAAAAHVATATTQATLATTNGAAQVTLAAAQASIATAQAAIATDQAAAAAASAVLAGSLATGQLIYMGSWDASGGSYPGSPVTGAFYKVAVAGTITGTAYAVNDDMIYNGATWDKIDNQVGATPHLYAFVAAQG